MSTTVEEPQGADEETVRAFAPALRDLAAQFGIADLRFASPGRLLGRVAAESDAFDVAAFELAAEALLGARVSLLSDSVLAKPNVSSDLVSARSL